MERRADVLIGATIDSSFDNALRQADRDIDRLASDANRHSARIGGAAAGASTMSLGTMGAASAAYTSQMGMLDAQIEKNRQFRQGMQQNAMEVVALGAALYGMTSPALHFEDAMADVAKIVADGTEEGDAFVDGLGESVRELTETIPMAHRELTELVAAGARMGVPKEELMDYTDMVAKMATAWGMSAEQVGLEMGKIGDVMGLSMEEVKLLGDAINSLDDSSTAFSHEITNMMMRISGVMATVNVEANQAAALSTAMINLGVGPERASAALIAMFGKLQNAPNLTDKAIAAFKTMGLTAEQVQEAVFEDGIGAVKLLQKSLEGLDDAQRAAALASIFGTGVMTANIEKLLTSQAALDESLQTVAGSDYIDSVQREFDRRMSTGMAKIKLFGNAVYDLGITIGNTLLPSVKDGTISLTAMVHSLNDLIAAHPGTSKAILMLTAGLVAMRLASIGASFGMGLLNGAFLQFRKTALVTQSIMSGFAFRQMSAGFASVARGAKRAQTRIGSNVWGRVGITMGRAAAGVNVLRGAFMALSVTMMTTPVGWVVLGIAAAIAAAAVLIYKYWEPLRAFFAGMWSGLSGIFTDMGAALADVFSPFTAALEPLKPLFEGVSTAISGTVQWFRNLLSPVELSSDGLADVYDKGYSFGTMLKDFLVGGVKRLLLHLKLLGYVFWAISWAIQHVVSWFGRLGASFGEAYDAMMLGLSNLWDGFNETMTNIIDLFGMRGAFDAAMEFMGGIWEGIKTGWNFVINGFANMLNNLLDLLPNAAKRALGIEIIPTIMTPEEIEQEVEERMEGHRDDRFNENAARVSAEREARRIHENDERGVFGGKASDEVKEKRQEFVESTVAHQRRAHSIKVQREKYNAEKAIRDELTAQNSAAAEDMGIRLSEENRPYQIEAHGASDEARAWADNFVNDREARKAQQAQDAEDAEPSDQANDEALQASVDALATAVEAQATAKYAGAATTHIYPVVESEIVINGAGMSAEDIGFIIHEQIYKATAEAVNAERDSYLD